MRAERVLRRDSSPQLLLLGQRQLRDLAESVWVEARELLAVERRTLEEVSELLAVALVVQGELLVPGQPLGVSHAGTRPPLPPSRPAGSRGDSPAPRPDGRGDRPCARGSEGPPPQRRGNPGRA